LHLSDVRLRARWLIFLLEQDIAQYIKREVIHHRLLDTQPVI
jgi:hypothetical protein